ncbi:small acid-soluble spore protein P (minor) [Melghiribacillus thermohalophilus]|uniref:Small acid-soluble spore protein P (Minor) n=1 Tax=Melghiribacillus thermohalophilus TaxID=1324956 RepID=A0A4R3NDG8_9BACI|nr:small acid-soluble spore protein P [Melghiribacillus thermohalophilus]TCT26655.1 small acid-soluble spore protein P (minor) [Melghiribacillus thermohalophilus]
MTEKKKISDYSKLKNQARQPYGEPMKGSKKMKNKNHSRQTHGTEHDL